ncbi:hypothetical protein, partial [Aquirufa aurantiipilula]
MAKNPAKNTKQKLHSPEPQSSENQDNSPEIANEIEASNDELFSPEVQEVLKDIPKEKRRKKYPICHCGPLSLNPCQIIRLPLELAANCGDSSAGRATFL